VALERPPKRGCVRAKWAIVCMLFFSVLASASIPAAENEDPWEFLSDFRHVEGAIRPVDNRHVVALFYHSGKQLGALVIFPSICQAQRCSLENPVAYSVFDQRGIVLRSHENNSKESLLQKVLTSASTAFTAA